LERKLPDREFRATNPEQPAVDTQVVEEPDAPGEGLVQDPLEQSLLVGQGEEQLMKTGDLPEYLQILAPGKDTLTESQMDNMEEGPYHSLNVVSKLTNTSHDFSSRIFTDKKREEYMFAYGLLLKKLKLY
jgi:hypothetical protein